MTSADPSFEAEHEVGRIHAFFPILSRLGNEWARSRPWEGLTIGLNLHLTTLTAALVRELSLGGGTFVVSGANPATTDRRVVEMLRAEGIEVYTGGDLEDRHLQVLDHQPDLLVDAGFELARAAFTRRKDLLPKIRGVVEVSRSGIARLREHGAVPFPVVNVNDGRLKNAVENRHGVGDAIWQAVASLTGMHLSGRRVAVVGYGPVGRGLANHAKAAGMAVEVVERDPIRRLFAHYDGYPTPSLADALRRVGVVATATGVSGAVKVEDLAHARDRIVLVNAGHGGGEIDVAGIRRAAERVDHIADQVVQYQLDGGPRLLVLGDGHPLNIVVNAGSPEPVLLHFAVLGLALERLATQAPGSPGEQLVAADIENRAAVVALESLNLAGA